MALSTRRLTCRYSRIAAALAATALIFLGSVAAAAEAPARAGKIEIQSDRLTVDSQNRTAEFSGRVKARQGQTTIEADRIRVYYKEAQAESIQSLERIEAAGNVRIRFENGLAETPEAVYNIDSRVFELIGEGSTVTSGKSRITGDRIILRQDDGQVTVEGGAGGQVEAVFFPGDENRQGE